MGIVRDLLYCIHQCGWNISLQVLLRLFKAKHMVVCVCVLMWICRNCKAIVWLRVRRERSDQDQHKFFTEHIAVFIRALSGSNTEKKWT